MTPVLPSLTGFIPSVISRVFPNASVIRGAQWSESPLQYTNDKFLQPFGEHLAQLQKSFISSAMRAMSAISTQQTPARVTNIATSSHFAAKTSHNEPWKLMNHFQSFNGSTDAIYFQRVGPISIGHKKERQPERSDVGYTDTNKKQ
ncbi:hypothetical protein N7492_007222 [Penicillium capsulatum]|uniref:Alpha-N-acetylglucosaminidase tim-barrel domain-containing protein n=1 Tax=Penicillium capsulatum TaxID=69766 RepID=A0A9W9I4R1_9EURO|nr:hypothetical protein N7492_007222 [Penicillium capsulatum]KAJ6117060.1 hypothetical protein N7512_006785 [Penicillium capsulatum]